MQKMAVLLSGSGRTLDNFHDHIQDGSLNAVTETWFGTDAALW